MSRIALSDVKNTEEAPSPLLYTTRHVDSVAPTYAECNVELRKKAFREGALLIRTRGVAPKWDLNQVSFVYCYGEAYVKK